MRWRMYFEKIRKTERCDGMRKEKLSFVRMMRLFAFLMIPILVVDICAVLFSVYHSRQSYLLDVRNAIQTEAKRQDDMLLSINRYTNGLLYHNENLSQLLKADNRLDKVYYANCLLNDISLSTVFLPANYHFILYVPSQKLLLATETPEMGYAKKEALMESIRSTFYHDEYINQPQWRLFWVDDTSYFCQTYSQNGCFATCWTTTKAFFSFLDNAFHRGEGSYSLEGKTEKNQLNAWMGTMTQTFRLERYGEPIQYSFRYFGSAVSTLILLLALIMIALCVIAYGFFSARFYRQNILRPLQRFATELPDETELERIQSTASFLEIAQVADAIRRLYAQVNQLKIHFYEETIAKQKMELEYLRLQLRPHFFINCLTVIFNLSQQGEHRKIQKFCYNLSNYIRYLFGSGLKTVPLTEELQHIEEYLYIQNVRFHTKTHFVQLTAPLENAQVPSLMLLSLVENSVKHNRALVEELIIDLDVQEQEGMVIYTVKDNGSGFPPEGLKPEQSSEAVPGTAPSGIGLKNIRRQLELLYGERFQLICQNVKEGGAMVRISLPTLIDKDKNQGREETAACS